MTTEEKVNFTQRLKAKIDEVNELITESNKKLPEGETRLAIKIITKDWHPMTDISATNGMNKYISCTVSENISY